MDRETLIRAALDVGAAKAAVIDQNQIVYSETFRDMCAQNSCGMYGRCYMCPPDIGPIDRLMAEAQAYPRALLYQTIGELEDSFDIEGMQEAKKRHNQLSQRLRDALDVMDIMLLDHLVIADDDYVSMSDSGYLRRGF